MNSQPQLSETTIKRELVTPSFIYSRQEYTKRAELIKGLSAPFGWLPRFAAKANPHPEIIKAFDAVGLHFDASSSYEAQRLIELGVAGSKISLSSQQPAHNLDQLLQAGVLYTATSKRQLELFLQSENKPSSVGLRVNPGFGDGHNKRTTTGGAHSSFGLWHIYLPEALAMAKAGGVSVDRLHIHVGSGADPSLWGDVMEASLDIVSQMPDVTSLNIGGGYKVHRYGNDQETDMSEIINVFSSKLLDYQQKTGREIQLEVEPGTWLVAHAGVLVAEIVDMVDTGPDGYNFLKLNTGMNDIIRPSMYGAQHRMEVLNDSQQQTSYAVVGHNCETGDILTPAGGDPEVVEPRQLNEAKIGDLVAIYDAGAYCASFSAHGYNSFPDAAEVFVDSF